MRYEKLLFFTLHSGQRCIASTKKHKLNKKIRKQVQRLHAWNLEQQQPTVETRTGLHHIHGTKKPKPNASKSWKDRKHLGETHPFLPQPPSERGSVVNVGWELTPGWGTSQRDDLRSLDQTLPLVYSGCRRWLFKYGMNDGCQDPVMRGPGSWQSCRALCWLSVRYPDTTFLHWACCWTDL